MGRVISGFCSLIQWVGIHWPPGKVTQTFCGLKKTVPLFWRPFSMHQAENSSEYEFVEGSQDSSERAETKTLTPSSQDLKLENPVESPWPRSAGNKALRGGSGICEGHTVVGELLALTCHLAQARSLSSSGCLRIVWRRGEQWLDGNQELFNLGPWPVQGPHQQEDFATVDTHVHWTAQS